MNSYRTHTCGELRSSDVNKEVKLAGWIHRKRNLGNLCFVDLRDHYGITQCVFDSCLKKSRPSVPNRSSASAAKS